MDGCVRKGSLPVSASVTDLSGLLWTKIKKRRKTGAWKSGFLGGFYQEASNLGIGVPFPPGLFSGTL